MLSNLRCNTDKIMKGINRELAEMNRCRMNAKHNARVLKDSENPDAYTLGFMEGKEEAYRMAAKHLAYLMEELEYDE